MITDPKNVVCIQVNPIEDKTTSKLSELHKEVATRMGD